MKIGDRIQETGDSKRKGVTMAEVDAYYDGLLKELKDLEEMLNERTPVESTTLSPASRGIPRGKEGR